jgi:ketosteroid isomerase-like protein
MTRNVALTFFFIAASIRFAAAQQVKPGGIRIQTATRQVVLFSRLESDLNEAISQHDQSKLAAMLTEDFEVRTPNLAGDPIPRQNWITQAASGEVPQASRPGHMAVRSFSDTAIVDFVEQVRSDAAPHYRFVVDVWKGSGESWRLAVRYVSNTEMWEETGTQKATGKE